MNVKVENCLACFCVCVNDYPVSRAVDALFFSHAAHNRHQVTEKQLVVIQIVIERYYVFTRDDQQVHWGLGICVLKRDALLVFIEDFRRFFVFGYLAEDASVNLHHPSFVGVEKQFLDSKMNHST
jgi:hypothetical protein